MSPLSFGSGRLHLALTGILAAGLLVLGLLVAVGTVQIRFAGQERKSQPEERPALLEPIIEVMPEAEKVFDRLIPLGYRGNCWTFRGAWIECAFDIEVNGKKMRLEGTDRFTHQLREKVAEFAKKGIKENDPAGHLTWVQARDTEEIWDLYFTLFGLDESGNAFSASVTEKGIVAPQPTGTPTGAVDDYSLDGSLRGGRQVTLVTLQTFGEDKGQNLRTVTLKCQAAR